MYFHSSSYFACLLITHFPSITNIHPRPFSRAPSEFYDASLDNFTTVLQAMKTIDGSEISDVFTPSKQEILEAGVRPEEFISSCSFDGEKCNYT